jgi:hypothetical protein
MDFVRLPTHGMQSWMLLCWLLGSTVASLSTQCTCVGEGIDTGADSSLACTSMIW